MPTAIEHRLERLKQNVASSKKKKKFKPQMFARTLNNPEWGSSLCGYEFLVCCLLFGCLALAWTLLASLDFGHTALV